MFVLLIIRDFIMVASRAWCGNFVVYLIGLYNAGCGNNKIGTEGANIRYSVLAVPLTLNILTINIQQSDHVISLRCKLLIEFISFL